MPLPTPPASRAVARRRAAVLLATLVSIGAAWAAVEQFVVAPRLAQADRDAAGATGAPAGEAPAATPGDEAAEAAPVPSPELTEAEMEAELAAIEAAAGTAPRDAGERAAETPLPADLPIALPSDI